MRSKNGSEDAPYQTKATIVARFLRKAIISGRIPIGGSVRQEHVAAELGLSPTPVREALRLLEAEGFLRSVPHRGVRVVAPSRDHLADVFELRRLIEGHAAELAADRITEDELADLERLCLAMAIAVEAGDYAEVRGLDYEFHEAINQAAKVPPFQAIVNYLWAGFDWSILETNPGRLRRSLVEHRVILDALRRRDAAGAREALVAQIRNSQADALAPQRLEPVASPKLAR